MKHFKQLLCMALLFLLALPLGATEGKSGDFDPSSIVLGHIKDSYDWHVTDIGDKAVVIHLPIIVKSSTGWHVFSSSQFGEEADAKGYRHGPYGLAIASAGDHAGKIVELQSDGSEAVPLDISITKTVAVLFIDAILLLVCILGRIRRLYGDAHHLCGRQHCQAWSGRGLREVFSLSLDMLLLHLHLQSHGRGAFPSGWGQCHRQHHRHVLPRSVHVHHHTVQRHEALLEGYLLA